MEGQGLSLESPIRGGSSQNGWTEEEREKIFRVESIYHLKLWMVLRRNDTGRCEGGQWARLPSFRHIYTFLQSWWPFLAADSDWFFTTGFAGDFLTGVVSWRMCPLSSLHNPPLNASGIPSCHSRGLPCALRSSVRPEGFIASATEQGCVRAGIWEWAHCPTLSPQPHPLRNGSGHQQAWPVPAASLHAGRAGR